MPSFFEEAVEEVGEVDGCVDGEGGEGYPGLGTRL